MLYAHKNELHARLSRDLISVRSRELDYYTTNIRNIGFSAALLTGFAFGTLANHKSSDMLDWLVPYAEEFEGVDIQPPFILLSDFAINGLQRLQVTLEVAYLVSNITGSRPRGARLDRGHVRALSAVSCAPCLERAGARVSIVRARASRVSLDPAQPWA